MAEFAEYSDFRLVVFVAVLDACLFGGDGDDDAAEAMVAAAAAMAVIVVDVAVEVKAVIVAVAVVAVEAFFAAVFALVIDLVTDLKFAAFDGDVIYAAAVEAIDMVAVEEIAVEVGDEVLAAFVALSGLGWVDLCLNNQLCKCKCNMKWCNFE